MFVFHFLTHPNWKTTFTWTWSVTITIENFNAKFGAGMKSDYMKPHALEESNHRADCMEGFVEENICIGFDTQHEMPPRKSSLSTPHWIIRNQIDYIIFEQKIQKQLHFLKNIFRNRCRLQLSSVNSKSDRRK